MSQSNMSGFISEEQDKEFVKVFSESMRASQFIRAQLPKDGDRLWFTQSGGEQWLEIRNKGGRLYIEIGEGAA